MSRYIKDTYPSILRKNLEGFFRDDLVLKQEKSLAQSRQSQVGAWDESQQQHILGMVNGLKALEKERDMSYADARNQLMKLCLT